MNAVPPGVVGDVGDDGDGCVMQKDIGDAGAAVGNRCGFKSGSEVPQPQDETDNHSATNPANYKMEWEREKERKKPWDYLSEWPRKSPRRYSPPHHSQNWGLLSLPPLSRLQ